MPSLLPSFLEPAPRRPGGAKADTDVKPGVHVVDWVDERTQLSGGLRWVMFRKVPKGTNWFYTLGTASMFAFLSQAVTGIFLASMSAVANFFFIPYYPLWAILLIALDIWVIWSLTRPGAIRT